MNATLTKRIDTQYEESDGHHETLNNTIHLKHSDLVHAVGALKKEFDSKITQLETALRSKVDSDRQDVQGKLFLYQCSTYNSMAGPVFCIALLMSFALHFFERYCTCAVIHMHVDVAWP